MEEWKRGRECKAKRIELKGKGREGKSWVNPKEKKELIENQPTNRRTPFENLGNKGRLHYNFPVIFLLADHLTPAIRGEKCELRIEDKGWFQLSRSFTRWIMGRRIPPLYFSGNEMRLFLRYCYSRIAFPSPEIFLSPLPC